MDEDLASSLDGLLADLTIMVKDEESAPEPDSVHYASLSMFAGNAVPEIPDSPLEEPLRYCPIRPNSGQQSESRTNSSPRPPQRPSSGSALKPKPKPKPPGKNFKTKPSSARYPSPTLRRNPPPPRKKTVNSTNYTSIPPPSNRRSPTRKPTRPTGAFPPPSRPPTQAPIRLPPSRKRPLNQAPKRLSPPSRKQPQVPEPNLEFSPLNPNRRNTPRAPKTAPAQYPRSVESRSGTPPTRASRVIPVPMSRNNSDNSMDRKKSPKRANPRYSSQSLRPRHYIPAGPKNYFAQGKMPFAPGMGQSQSSPNIPTRKVDSSRTTTAPPSKIDLAEWNKIKTLLKKYELSQYADLFEEKGFTTVRKFMCLTEKRLQSWEISEGDSVLIVDQVLAALSGKPEPVTANVSPEPVKAIVSPEPAATSPPAAIVRYNSLSSIQDLDPSAKPEVRRGFLIKGDSKLKNWKRRWFILNEFSIAYYKNPKAAAPIKMMVLTPEATVKASFRQERKGFEFAFYPGQGNRTFYIRADTETSMRAWMETILKNIHLCKREKVNWG
eukprot:TRINITY_DN4501_c0_g1_i1.p1 TRINITY_DN4501_c0_g1~~TRINITY_DN4501_c0_g1_i1.p1  ORF type:complete len:560 (-),score=50.44 TRINITY_DN4501_c0_g1_i1:147-1796(-)